MPLDVGQVRVLVIRALPGRGDPASAGAPGLPRSSGNGLLRIGNEQLRARAAAHGDITIQRLLTESALAPRDSTPMYDRRELLAELFALRRLLAGAATNVNQVAQVADATGAVPVRQSESEWLRRVAGPCGRLDEVIERVAETARAGRVDVA